MKFRGPQKSNRGNKLRSLSLTILNSYQAIQTKAWVQRNVNASLLTSYKDVSARMRSGLRNQSEKQRPKSEKLPGWQHPSARTRSAGAPGAERPPAPREARPGPGLLSGLRFEPREKRGRFSRHRRQGSSGPAGPAAGRGERALPVPGAQAAAPQPADRLPPRAPRDSASPGTPNPGTPARPRGALR